MDYWGKNIKRDPIEVQTEIIVMVEDTEAMTNLEVYAEDEFLEIFESNSRSISRLNESRKSVYEKLVNSSNIPIAITWDLPETIDFIELDDSSVYDKHLYVKSDNSFKTSLNTWESGLVQEELNKGAIAWLRNLDRKKWSLEIPYKSNGVTTPMFPDLIIVRKDEHGYIFDVLEPHDPNRKDNCDKARGLADFADDNWDKGFGKIQLIRKYRGADGRDHFHRLDMSKVNIRKKVRGVTSNGELDRIFRKML